MDELNQNPDNNKNLPAEQNGNEYYPNLPGPAPQVFSPNSPAENTSGIHNVPDPMPPQKKSKKKLIIVIGVLIIIAGLGVFLVASYLEKKEPATPANQQSKQVKSFSLDSIKTKDDLAFKSNEERKAFCTELLKYDAEGPEVNALHKRLGLSGELNENLWLGCSITLSGDEYIKKDKSGENDAQYRINAQKYRDIAKTVQFDLYDTTYEVADLRLSKRVAIDISGEAKNLLMEYSTLVNGGFSPYSSKQLIRIQVFNIADFPALKSNCGPSLMVIKFASQQNNDSCVKTQKSFKDAPIYKGDGIGNDSYNVTVNGTRISVEARNENEALSVIQSMKIVPLEKLDFFIKN